MLKPLLLRWGLPLVVVGITAASIAISILIAAGLTYGVFHGSMGFSAWVITVTTPALIAPVMTYLTLRLVMQLEQARAALDYEVHHDPLTALHNRRYFMQALHRQISLAAGGVEPFAVAIMDVDDFKAINDRHGHLGGDEVLRQLAQQCRARLRSSDIFARIGGEEFALLIRNAEHAQAWECAERFLEAARSLQVATPDGPQCVTISIGLAYFRRGMSLAHGRSDTTATPAENNQHSESGGCSRLRIDQILRAADGALYTAKRKGKNRIEVAAHSEGS